MVYLWVDGIYVKAGLEKEKAALLVDLGALRDGRKVILAVESGHRESTESWSAVLRDLKQRGLPTPNSWSETATWGFWGALANVYPAAAEQPRWNHRIVNVLDRIPKKTAAGSARPAVGDDVCGHREMATSRKEQFQNWCRKHGCAPAGELLDYDWDRLVAYYSWQPVNRISSPNFRAEVEVALRGSRRNLPQGE